MSKPLISWANETAAECLQGEPSISKALRGFEGAPRRSLLRDCQGYLLDLLNQLGSGTYGSSRNSRLLRSLSVDMLLSRLRLGPVPGPCCMCTGVRQS